MKIEDEIKLDFRDVLIRPKRSELDSRSDVALERTFRFKHSGRTWTGVPVIVSNMDTTGTFEMYRALAHHKMITCFHKHYEVDDYPLDMDPDYYMISTGTSERDWDKLAKLVSRLSPHFICIDVANGYRQSFVSFVSRVHEAYPEITLVAGNVVTREMVEELSINGGIDICKVGIGSGSVCLTRVQTGVGYPQLSAVIECSDAAHGVQTHVISDGGAQCAGDVAKAFGAGADFVMLGSMFAGHDESGGELMEDEVTGEKYKTFYGMSSTTAMEKYQGGVARHRSSEGKTVRTPYRGPVEGTVQSILGGVRSTCTYVGADALKKLSRCTTFIRVNRQVSDQYVGSANLRK